MGLLDFRRVRPADVHADRQRVAVLGAPTTGPGPRDVSANPGVGVRNARELHWHTEAVACHARQGSGIVTAQMVGRRHGCIRQRVCARQRHAWSAKPPVVMRPTTSGSGHITDRLCSGMSDREGNGKVRIEQWADGGGRPANGTRPLSGGQDKGEGESGDSRVGSVEVLMGRDFGYMYRGNVDCR